MATAQNNYVTRQDFERFGEKLHKNIVEDISDVIQTFAGHVDDRFNKVEFRLDKVEARLDGLEERAAKLEEGQTRLVDTLDAFLKRLDDIEKDNYARDAQLARFDRWIQQIAQKTGVKLEY